MYLSSISWHYPFNMYFLFWFSTTSIPTLHHQHLHRRHPHLHLHQRHHRHHRRHRCHRHHRSHRRCRQEQNIKTDGIYVNIAGNITIKNIISTAGFETLNDYLSFSCPVFFQLCLYDARSFCLLLVRWVTEWRVNDGMKVSMNELYECVLYLKANKNIKEKIIFYLLFMFSVYCMFMLMFMFLFLIGTTTTVYFCNLLGYS